MKSSSPIEPLSPILPKTTTTTTTTTPIILSTHLSSSSSTCSNSSDKLISTTTLASNKSKLKSDTTHFRIQGWDPILILSQILFIQSTHYLILSFILPPLLFLFSHQLALEFQGGPKNIAMVLDWRAMVGKSTLRSNYPPTPSLQILNLVQTTKSSNPVTSEDDLMNMIQSNLQKKSNHNLIDSNLDSLLQYDSNRSWVISIAWFISSLIGVFTLYQIVRRPKHIMDHSLTLCLIHFILSCYYSSQFPTSFWFYFVLIFSAILQIILAEQICVRREFRDGLGLSWKINHRPDDH